MADHSGNSHPGTVGEAIAIVADRFSAAKLYFGHGTVDARDEAAWLVFGVAGLDHADGSAAYALALDDATWSRIEELALARTQQRTPLAYLLNEAWFAGQRFYVDERVLVPRSPLAELIGEGFEPWIADSRIRRILDIGTGSGCIAIAMALAYPQAEVVASDVSAAALEVAALNVAAFGLEDRVRLVRSDVFDALSDERFDVIISNPPYVDAPTMRSLPEEYLREPELGLAAGEDGLSVVRRILHDAAKFLGDHGILVVEVGDSQQRVDETYPDLPLTWIELSDGASGIFLLHRDDLGGRSVTGNN